MVLFLPNADRSRSFTTPSRSITASGLPERERNNHAAKLLAQFDAAWAVDTESRAVGAAAREGTYVEFQSSPGFDLTLRSLEDLRSGMRLMNVRSKRAGDEVVELATVFVPDSAKAKFIQKLTDYALRKTKGGAPKNKRLVESIDDIQQALVRSFWTETDKDREPPTTTKQWVEVWLNAEEDDELGRFRTALRTLNIAEHESQRFIRFPERSVLVVHADGNDLAALIAHSDQVAEFRAAHEPATPIAKASNKEQTERVEELAARSTYPSDDRVAVCILDTGVNNGHALLGPLLASTDLHAVDPLWSKSDLDGHGTLMAGLAAYGDLQEAITHGQPVQLSHILESSKVLPDQGSNPERLYGAITAQAVYEPEIAAPHRSRIVCHAITSESTSDEGRPTSWSGMVDRLTSGAEDDKRRLLIQAAGNIYDPAEWNAYPASNFTKQVHDPAQAWNALTVGACTFRDRITDPNYAGYTPVARSGELSPFTTTSLLWDSRWPIKPEVVFEGGNAASAPNSAASDIDDLQLLSTYHRPQQYQFGYHNATSAATAQAAWMAAHIQRAYPEAWPETLRALMIHSAEWTPGMRQQCMQGTGTAAMRHLLRSCGYGKPILDKALHCLRNRLTLISQAEIQPFAGGSTNEMHLYELPWPKDVLLELGATEVRMRVTLSYFIEPGPGDIGWKNRYRYPSHSLRFELNSAGESADEFMRRINAEARTEEEGRPGTRAPQEWIIGPNTRNKGSIHSDIWSGRAADLATSNLIAVHPVIGWWRERKHLGKSNKRTRYSLVVSIETPEEKVDIYTPVAVQVGVPVPVPIPIVQ